MCKSRETMIALFFLVILFLCHSQATLFQASQGDYPDAKEVKMKLPRTYLFQSAFKILTSRSTLECAVQVFYTQTYRSQTYQKYNMINVYTSGRFQDQPLYVRGFKNYTILLDNRPEEGIPPRRSLQILYSDEKSCMVTTNPDSHFPKKACSLLVTEETFGRSPTECKQAYSRHCGVPAHIYTDISPCRKRNN
uniref:Putative secreted protein n=1 Tax=Ixodes ricinus TaxID=34613 RepID=A0A090XB69_IXORI